MFMTEFQHTAGEEEELAKLVEHLDKASTAYGIEISAEKGGGGILPHKATNFVYISATIN